jgi:programmed cell death protein 5
MNMAKQGQIRERISEKQLIDLLEQISEQQSAPKITYSRRRDSDDDDDEW